GAQLPTTGQAGESVSLRFRWQALKNIQTNYTLFVHVVDQYGEIASQLDASPMPDLFTINWLPDYALIGEYQLPLPRFTGSYDIYAGLYNDMGRLFLPDGTDRLYLGEIELE
ncbi:MAG: hypothetical protein KC496_16170, partial [Anaerolineae bacterium]|nr:hypothetical protein [Anaerolineae bacterium]